MILFQAMNENLNFFVQLLSKVTARMKQRKGNVAIYSRRGVKNVASKIQAVSGQTIAL